MVESGVDINSSMSITQRFRPGPKTCWGTWQACTVGDLALVALAMQANPRGSVNHTFSLYLSVISYTGVELSWNSVTNMVICEGEEVRFKSTCLDLLLSENHRVDLCEFVIFSVKVYFESPDFSD